jgi:polyhydroxybutyrate depolymerase
MKTMSHLLAILAFVLLLSTVACSPGAVPPATPAATIQPSDSERKLSVDGLERSYLLHIPPGLDKGQSVPVVFAFHGYTQSAALMTSHGFNALADKNGFLVVYPSGVGASWNATICCGEALDKGIDDLVFVQAMLADLGTIAHLDPKRIYATGFSNGAIFSYRLACEMSDTFAAIAPVAGWLATNPCQPKEPVSVLHEHGLSDNYAGGTTTMKIKGVYTQVEFPPVEQFIATWVQLDGCSGPAHVVTKGNITHTVYTNCRAGSAVELYAIENEAHVWPADSVLPMAKTIWEFFAAHPKP